MSPNKIQKIQKKGTKNKNVCNGSWANPGLILFVKQCDFSGTKAIGVGSCLRMQINLLARLVPIMHSS